MGQEREKQQVPSCHGNHSGKGHYWHMILMVLCCLIPFGVVFIAPRIGIPSNLSWLATLICPLMMVGMMVMMCWPGKEKK